MKYLLLANVCVVLLAVWARAELPSLTVPDGLGVNIHFTGAPARDLDLLQAAGFRFIRMDFTWEGIERQKGVYNFEPYDQLTDALERRGIRALYILDYSNPLYEKDRSVRTEEGRQAFARFAATAAQRYAGRGIVWELWNEPNISFWQPQPSVNDYMVLAKAVFPAIRAADPRAFCVAPATSAIPLDFLESCFKKGLLQLVDAITVHPYRQQPPETVPDDILRLRALIARYRPDKPDLAILSGEWGYSSAWINFDEQRQGQYLPRQFLVNLSLGIPVSIWYYWHDDGADPKDPEHHFGTVTLDYAPKPAYVAMSRLVGALRGMHFVKRLESASDDWLLLFTDGTKYTIAAWTTGPAHEIKLLPWRTLALSGEVQYAPIPPGARNILAEAAWTAIPHCAAVMCGAGFVLIPTPNVRIQVRNPFDKDITAGFSATPSDGVRGQFNQDSRLSLRPGQVANFEWQGVGSRRDTDRLTVKIEANVAGFRSSQVVTYLVRNPISLSLAPFGERLRAVVHIDEPFEGDLDIHAGGRTVTYSANIVHGGGTAKPVDPRDGKPMTTLKSGNRSLLSLPEGLDMLDQRMRLVLRVGDRIVADSGTMYCHPLKVSADKVQPINDGDPKVPAEIKLDAVEDKVPVAGSGLRLTYDFEAGWKFVRIAPPADVPIVGKPVEIGVWVKGDGSSNLLRMRFRDANNRYFQPEFGAIDFTGWRYLTAPLNNPNVGTWDGKPDVLDIVYPIRLNTYILLDSTQSKTSGEVVFGSFVLIYKTGATKEQ